MMANELKPVNCGCGGEAMIETDHDTVVPGEPIDWKRVVCHNCNIRTTWRHTEAEAVQSWNRAMGGSCRKCNNHDERTAKVETVTANNGHTWVQCSRCYQEVAKGFPYCAGCGAKLDWGGNE